ncbi:Uncharacterized protein HZ326_3337 [Fusarium oxysporum f. sp. albedinis]|nr:Uncharacterized protein HZ326_3337 [Fusarium oxysporum f. sp. albedinis]
MKCEDMAPLLAEPCWLPAASGSIGLFVWVDVNAIGTWRIIIGLVLFHVARDEISLSPWRLNGRGMASPYYRCITVHPLDPTTTPSYPMLVHDEYHHIDQLHPDAA